MADIAMQIDVAAAPADVYTALTSTDGVSGWWTTRNETRGVVGQVDRFWFPDAPMSWDMEVTEATPGESVRWHCVGGPPDWIGTDVRWTLQESDGGTLVVFDHTGFAEVGPMFRIVTLGWAQMLERLQRYLASGAPVPYFDHKPADSA
jgi:uncharacterized protein YndB with AHSA1/START domain